MCKCRMWSKENCMSNRFLTGDCGPRTESSWNVDNFKIMPSMTFFGVFLINILKFGHCMLINKFYIIIFWIETSWLKYINSNPDIFDGSVLSFTKKKTRHLSKCAFIISQDDKCSSSLPRCLVSLFYFAVIRRRVEP